ncbi:DUF4436 domain-containing protein [Streptomyces venezuelae]|uniref:DUF4436 domain-containing protein n=1 Tax=Streptomyces venezuelae (strain ATCC 10712 / CBS 650.69 / DSM 40230 / JCM 4526 / NBRC 13096 / PD 04745) TaxID=953739 RepID=F2RKM3_STRVP|nr:DUF4436 domain-containing protein [Streptomyces venezuelae]APE25706.1 DUF4436 domain-containing protein [Streptomyces venezuelae]QES03044.1 DUF4436 domain-containing protein [Streptomyces venezuelae ATCC 10712]QES10062.1 DUF4436 domain-containing protein [Streptomyces venezuelae]CCA60379.1 hypothetical protein SVEN_7093 [Streptomyces venezuelae ATCC 10712]
MSLKRRHTRAPGGPLSGALVLLAVAAAALCGLWLQFGERQDLDTRFTAGGQAPDRIDIDASVQRVDATGRELVLRVLVTPRGALAEAGGISPTEDLTLQTSSAVRGDLSFPAHGRIATVEVPVALTGGAVTDYPFDAYETEMEFGAVQGGRTVPVRMTLSNRDALFSLAVDTAEVNGAAVFSAEVARSRSVLVFAVFMMLAMWALTVAVLMGGRHLVRRRMGLTWPALGWMAATLFALAAFRNTAPGAPPIGSLLDYLAFFWAETLIAFCVTVVVVRAVRAEGPPPPRDASAP